MDDETRITAEGPWEPGTITLVEADTDLPLHYGGNSLATDRVKKGATTNIGLAQPGMRVRKRWTTSPSQVKGEGEGIIVGVEDQRHVYGPVIHVLWSKQPGHVIIPPASAANDDEEHPWMRIFGDTHVPTLDAEDQGPLLKRFKKWWSG